MVNCVCVCADSVKTGCGQRWNNYFVSCWVAGRIGHITVTELLEMPGCYPCGWDPRWVDPTGTDDDTYCDRWSHKGRGQFSQDAVINTSLPLVFPVLYLQVESKLEPLGLAITLLLLSFFWRTVFSKINWWAEHNNLQYLTFQYLVGKHYWIREEIKLRYILKKKRLLGNIPVYAKKWKKGQELNEFQL